MSIKRGTEGDILRGCLQYLALRGIFCWRQNQGAIPLKGGGYRKFVGLKGVSDILGVVEEQAYSFKDDNPVTVGRVLAVEVKKPGGKLSREQKQFLDTVREKGGLALCVRSVAELELALRAEGVIV